MRAWSRIRSVVFFSLSSQAWVCPVWMHFTGWRHRQHSLTLLVSCTPRSRTSGLMRCSTCCWICRVCSSSPPTPCSSSSGQKSTTRHADTHNACLHATVRQEPVQNADDCADIHCPLHAQIFKPERRHGGKVLRFVHGQARSLPTSSLRPLFLAFNAVVYAVQAALWVLSGLAHSPGVH